MKLWFKLAFLGLKNKGKFSSFFVLNLSLGWVGLMFLGSFQESVLNYLNQNLRDILTADLIVFGNRPLQSDEQAELQRIFSAQPGQNQTFQTAQMASMYTMASSNNQAKLSNIIAIDNQYPLYGNFELAAQGVVTVDKIEQNLQQQPQTQPPQAWMLTQTRNRLGIELGESVRIGNQEFLVIDDIAKQPAENLALFAFAPTIYIGLNQLHNTGLVSLGSRIRYTTMLKTDQDVKVLAEQIKQQMLPLNTDLASLNVRTYHDASQSLTNLLEQVRGYLSLIALIALFLAGTSIAYLFRSYLQNQLKEIAILMSLGATQAQVVWMFTLQLILLGLASALSAWVITWVLVQGLPLILQGILPTGLELKVNLQSIWLTLVLAVFGSWMFCMPVLLQLRKIQPIFLLQQNQKIQNPPGWLKTNLIASFAVAVFFLGLAIWVAGFKAGSLFLLIFLACLLVLSGLGLSLFALFNHLAARTNFKIKIALRNLYRQRLGALSCFLAIALGTFLINLVPQIQKGMEEEIMPSNSNVPSMFLFDIQPEQLNPLKQLVAEQGFQLQNTSAMVRARLVSHNGKEPSSVDTTENDRPEYRRNTFNLSYRAGLDASEKIVAGQPFLAAYDPQKPIPASVELGFAKRRSWKIGDQLVFDVSGLLVNVEIQNLRKVNWNSFQPNFFIVLQPGLLEDAPQTFLATIPKIPAEQIADLQAATARQFPNISFIDVEAVISRITLIAEKLLWVAKSVAYLAIFAGIVVVFSIARLQAHNRNWEVNLMKVLGTQFLDLQLILLFEYGLLALSAALLGIGLSLIASWVLAFWLLDGNWQISWLPSLLSLLVIFIIVQFTVWLASYRILRQKPWWLLRST